MGLLELNMDRLNEFFKNTNLNFWENQEIDKFVKNAFSVGYNKTVEDAFTKELGLIQLNFSYNDFFNLQKDKNVVRYFEKFINEEEDFDDILFYIAENNSEDFFKLYEDNFTSNSIDFSSLERSASFSPSEPSEYLEANYSLERDDNEEIDFSSIINELDKRISFAIRIKDLLVSNRDFGQDNLTNINLINIIENQVKKNINQSEYFGKNGFLRHILNQSFELQKNTENFFNEDLLRTKEFFDKTLDQLQYLKKYIEDYRDRNLARRSSYKSRRNLEVVPSVEETYDILNFNKKPSLDKLTEKLGLSLNKGIFINTFAVNRIRNYRDDIKKIKSEVEPIINEWDEE